MGLTNKQKIFVENYLLTFNATQAAIAAGYSPRSARAIGAENLTKPVIAQELQSRINEATVGADQALLILSSIARNEGSEYYFQDGSIDIPSLIRDGKGYLIKSAKPSKWGLVVEFYDALAALALIGKHHKLFTEQTAFEGTFHIEGLDQLLDRIYGKGVSTINLSHESPAIPAEGGK